MCGAASTISKRPRRADVLLRRRQPRRRADDREPRQHPPHGRRPGLSAPDLQHARPLLRRCCWRKDLPIPTVHDDLQHHASGCYAAHSGIKRWNRRAENLLLAAEKWCAIAERVTGQPYPAELERAWKHVLFNQFHDILARHQPRAGLRRRARPATARRCRSPAAASTTRSQSLAWNIDLPHTEDGMTPIVVFNPHAWQQRHAGRAGYRRGGRGRCAAGRRGPARCRCS